MLNSNRWALHRLFIENNLLDVHLPSRWSFGSLKSNRSISKEVTCSASEWRTRFPWGILIARRYLQTSKPASNISKVSLISAKVSNPTSLPWTSKKKKNDQRVEMLTWRSRRYRGTDKWRQIHKSTRSSYSQHCIQEALAIWHHGSCIRDSKYKFRGAIRQAARWEQSTDSTSKKISTWLLD